jgi:transcriptional regulator with XRE-family HTH domain
MQEAQRIADLAAKLVAIKQRGLARQLDMEEKTGVDQTAISRALHGHYKRMSPALERLDGYADMLLVEKEVPEKVRHAAREFLGLGGTESELLASIDLARRLITRRLA